MGGACGAHWRPLSRPSDPYWHQRAYVKSIRDFESAAYIQGIITIISADIIVIVLNDHVLFFLNQTHILSREKFHVVLFSR